MKTAFLCLCMIPFFIGNNLSYAQEESAEVSAVETTLLYNNITNSLSSFFEALKMGDIDKIRPFLSDKIRKNYSTLFDKNEYYGDYLRKWHEGTTFQIKNFVSYDDGVKVDLRMDRNDGTTNFTEIYVKEETSIAPGGVIPVASWKVVETKKGRGNKRNF